MKHTFKYLGGVVAGLALAVSMGAAPVTALAAGTVYVNDGTGNDTGINCPSTPYTDIQTGIDNALSGGSKMVVVCQGTYTAGGSVSSAPGGLTVKALGAVYVNPTGPYAGGLFQADFSGPVTFQGFIISSTNLIGAQAFYYYNAGGSIIQNSIVHWRSATPYAASGVNYGVYIHTDTKTSIKVDHNSFGDMSNYGVYVESPGGVTISHNRLKFFTVWTNGSNVPQYTNYTPYGISLQGTAGAKLLNNVLDADGNWGRVQNPLTRAISMVDSSSNQVTKNTVSGFWHGLWAYADCSATSKANTNSISSNLFNEDNLALSIGGWGSCAGTANGNKIAGNKVYTIEGGADGIIVQHSVSEVVTGNQVTGNTVAGYGVALLIEAGNTNSGNKTPAAPPPGA